MFVWVHQFSVLAHFCATFFSSWHKFVPALFSFWYSFVPAFLASILPGLLFSWSHFKFEKTFKFTIISRKNNRVFHQNGLFLLSQACDSEPKRLSQNCAKTDFSCKQRNPWLCQGWQWNCKHVFLMLFLYFLLGPWNFRFDLSPCRKPETVPLFWKKSLRINGHSHWI